MDQPADNRHEALKGDVTFQKIKKQYSGMGNGNQPFFSLIPAMKLNLKIAELIRIDNSKIF